MYNGQLGVSAFRGLSRVWSFRLAVVLPIVAAVFLGVASAAAVTVTETQQAPATTVEQPEPQNLPIATEDQGDQDTQEQPTEADPQPRITAPVSGFGGFVVGTTLMGSGAHLLKDDVTFRIRVTYTLPGNTTAADFPEWSAPGKLERDQRKGSGELEVSLESEADGPHFPAGTKVTLERVANGASITPANTSWGAGQFEPASFTVADQELQEVAYTAVLNEGNLPFTLAKVAGGVDGADEHEYVFKYTCNVAGVKHEGTMVVRGDGQPVESPKTFPAGTCCKVVELLDHAEIEGADLVTPKEQLTKNLVVGDKAVAPDVLFDNMYESANRVKVAKRPFDRNGALVQVAPDGTGEFTARYRLEFTNVRERPLLIAGDVFDEVAFPAGADILDVDIREEGSDVPLAGVVVEPQIPDGEVVRRRSVIPGAAIGEIPPKRTKTLLVSVRAQAHRELIEHVGEHRCVAADPTELEAGTPRGLQNSIIVGEQLKDLDGPDNNHACVELVLPRVTVEKAPRPAKAMHVRPNGTADLEYRIRVRNHEARAEAAVVALRDEPLLGTAEPVGDAKVTVAADHGVTLEQVATTVPQAELVAPFILAENIVLPAKTSLEFTVVIPVKVSAPQEDTEAWKQLGECYRNEVGEFVGGVRNRVLAPYDADGPENNTACIPLQFPERPLVRLSKVDFGGTPLQGAEFTIYPDQDGVAAAVPITGAAPVPADPNDPNVATIALSPGVYHLVESKAPKSHSLLARPVKFKVTPNADGTAYEIRLVSHDEYVASTDGLSLRVANTLAGELPKSGGPGQLWQLLLGLLVILGGAHTMRNRIHHQKAK